MLHSLIQKFVRKHMHTVGYKNALLNNSVFKDVLKDVKLSNFLVLRLKEFHNFGPPIEKDLSFNVSLYGGNARRHSFADLKVRVGTRYIF